MDLRALNAERRLQTYRPDLFSATPSVNAPSFAGAVGFGGAGTTEILGSASDPQGNTIVAGGFSGSVSFPNGPTFQAAGDYDVFVAKFSPSGQTLWARQAKSATGLAAGMAISGALAVAGDVNGNLYIGGGFVQSVTFVNPDGSAGTRLTSTGNSVGLEAFLVKYDTNGNLVWANGGQSGGVPGAVVDINGVEAIAADSKGNLFVSGTVSGSSFLGKSLPTTTSSAAVIAGVDSNTGSPVWLNEITDASGRAGVESLASDGAGGVFGLGFAESSVSIPGATTPIVLSGLSDTNAWWLARWSGSGQLLWAKQIGQGIIYMNDLASSQGLAYVAGEFDSAATIGSLTVGTPSGGTESLLVQFSAAGTAQWARSSVSAGSYAGSYASGVTVDTAGNSYVTGTFVGTVTIGSGIALTNVSETEYVASYDKSGAPLWIRGLANTGHAGAGYTGPASIPVSLTSSSLSFNPSLNSLQLTTDFSGSISFDANTLTSTAGNRFAVVARLPVNAPTNGPVVAALLNSASYGAGSFAPSSYATVFGTNLAATNGDSGTTISITDAAGTTVGSTIYFAGPGQVNFLVPGGLATGVGTLSLTNSAKQANSLPISISAINPGLFTADQSGTGAPAAQAIVVAANGSTTSPPVAVCSGSPLTCATATIPVASGTQTFLILYGTGIRDAKTVSATVGGVATTVAYAGPQGGFPGLDQINVLIPTSLAGRGEVPVILTADGISANAVKTRF